MSKQIPGNLELSQPFRYQELDRGFHWMDVLIVEIITYLNS